MYNGVGWKPYVSVAERRLLASRETAKLRKKGHPVSPMYLPLGVLLNLIDHDRSMEA
jgi:hypothetical protein